MNHLETSFKTLEDVAVTCIYCNYKERSRQTVLNLILSLLKQLVQDHSAIYKNIKPFYKLHIDQGTHPNLRQSQEAFELATAAFSKVFIIVDALDECSDGTRMELLSALQSGASTINLLVTSRDLALIAQEFSIHLNIRASDQDIQKYIAGRIAYASILQIHVKKDPKLQSEIIKAVTKNAEGMLVSHLASARTRH